MNRRMFRTLVLSTLVFCITVGVSHAQPTEFTFQGSLKNNGNPASGNHDFQFALFDSAAGGTQLGSTITLNGVPVTDGIFSVKLDFGNQFSGANRFLEIKVRQSGGGSFTTLSPRQSVSSSPYSIKSLNTENATTANNALSLGGLTANQFVLTTDMRLSDARNPLPNSPNYIQNGTTQQSFTCFNIGGNGIFGGPLSTRRRADVAFFRPATAQWFVLRPEDLSFFAFPFGVTTDTPAPGDYDGDGRMDAAVFRSSTAAWFIQGSTSGVQIQQFGLSTDRPLPNAFDR